MRPHCGWPPIAAITRPIRACVVLGVALALAIGASPARASTFPAASAEAESLTLTAGSSQYFFVGSTGGGKPMESIGWSPDLSVQSSYSHYQAISIGRSASDEVSYVSAAGSHAIAGVGVTGYTVKEVFRANASATGPGYSGGPETPAPGESVELPFNTQAGELVVILVGGQGTGELELSGITATTLQNATFSGGSKILASVAIYEAELPAGSYDARWESTTYLTNSGTSLGAVAYVLEPASLSKPSGGAASVTTVSPPTEPPSTHTSPVTAPTESAVPTVSPFTPFFATRAELAGSGLGLLVGIPAITGLQNGATVTVRCLRSCAAPLQIIRKVGRHSGRAIQLARPFALRATTVVEIAVSQPGHVTRYARYRFRRTEQAVIAYGITRGCITASGARKACA